MMAIVALMHTHRVAKKRNISKTYSHIVVCVVGSCVVGMCVVGTCIVGTCVAGMCVAGMCVVGMCVVGSSVVIRCVVCRYLPTYTHTDMHTDVIFILIPCTTYSLRYMDSVAEL